MDQPPGAFEADPLLGRLDTPVLGLNVAVHWPLPQAFRAEYERMRARLGRLDPGVYVYPFEQTHVTVATIVSFKRHERPDPADQARILSILPALGGRLEAVAEPLRPFTMRFGAPVLVSAAAFLPITNPTGEIQAIRQGLADGPWAEGLQIPRAIHSTILRFREPPRDPAGFGRDFAEIASEIELGEAVVDVLLITTETRPYMMAGRIVHRIQLNLPS